jgi:hypothetical protein
MFTDKDISILNILIERKQQNANLELETRVTQSIDSNQFIYLSKKLTELNYRRKQQNDEYMNISFAKSKAEQFYIRYTIDGIDNIRAYCKLETPTNPIKVYKNRVSFTEEELARLSVSGIKTDNIKDLSHFIRDYNIKFNCKMETTIDTDIKDPDANRENTRFERSLESVGYSNLLKVFRFIKRTSYYTPDEQFRIDLSIVKTNKKEYTLSGYENVIPSKSFKEAGVLNTAETFEVEIEYIGSLEKTDIIEGFKKYNLIILSNLFYYSLIPISKSLTHTITNSYGNSINNMIAQGIKFNIENNLEKLEKSSKKPSSDISKILTKRSQFITKSKIHKKNLLKYFYVPKVVSLTNQHLNIESPDNILNNYTVTDKADGITAILYIPKEHSGIYLYDSNMNMFCISETFKDVELSDTILAGEFVKSSLLSPTPQFLAFDCYMFAGKDTRHYPLISDDSIDTRVKCINNVLSKIVLENISTRCKDFEYKDGNIFELSKRIWDKKDTFNYKLDGLIYTPRDLPVGYIEGSFDYFIKMSTTWLLNIKWKPAHENTIDFLVKIEKEKIEVDKKKDIYFEKEKISYKTSLNGSLIEFTPYKTIHLYCGYKVSSDNTIIQSKDMKMFEKYLATKFTPTTPYDENAYIAHIKCDSNYNIWGLDDNTKILDNTIVEFAYDIDSKDIDDEFRWKPLKTRLDKTAQYNNALKEKYRLYNILTKYISNSEYSNKSYKLKDYEESELKDLEFIVKIIRDVGGNLEPAGILQTLIKNAHVIKNNIKNPLDIPIPISFGNNYDTANSIWKTIHFPITDEMITTGQNLPTKEDDEIVYYNRDVQSRNKSLTINMQRFHNKYVKNYELYKEVVKRLNKPEGEEIHLLELASGKIGDLFKWQENKINNVVAIDNIKNNIYDLKDGAIKRYIDFKKQNQNKDSFIPNVSFLIGDISKNIKTKHAFIDEKSQHEFENLWNGSKNYGDNQFDIISIQFAIHYMFENKEKLDGFLKNVSENLKPSGYFIGTTLNGSQIFRQLFSLEKGKFIEKTTKDGQLVWRIRKLYDNPSTNNNLATNYSLGMPIDVYLHSINQTIREYLVNYNYLKRELEKYSIVEVDEYPKDFSEILAKYKELEGDNFIKMEDYEKTYSILNTAFMFKKLDEEHVMSQKLYNYIYDYINLYDVSKLLSSIEKKKDDDERWEKLFSYFDKLPDLKITMANTKTQLRNIILKKLESGELVIPDVKKLKPIKKTTSTTKKTASKKSVVTSLIEDDKLSPDFKLSESFINSFKGSDYEEIVSKIAKEFNEYKNFYRLFKRKSDVYSDTEIKVLNPTIDRANKIIDQLPENYEEYDDFNKLKAYLTVVINKAKKGLEKRAKKTIVEEEAEE